MTKLHELFEAQGQSPWIDNLKRSFITDGKLAGLVDSGVRGVTSNPTIFANAIEGSDAYDDQYRSVLRQLESNGMTGHHSVEMAYWELVVKDVTDALAVMRPLYDSSGRTDGFVSIEVSPLLAHDTEATCESARSLHERISAPNLFVKIPATAEGIPAIRRMISEGRSINVTLVFSLERYDEVMEAYIGGLEELAAGGGDPSSVASVASFFVSRVDTEVDRRLEVLVASDPAGSKESRALSLRGRAAIAQAKLAYQLFLERFSGSRWNTLEERGARRQRPLWASTSTKNPAYSDLDYVDNLIGPHTVNTMPDATIEFFLDHGTIARTVDADVQGATSDLTDLAEVGIDMSDVARTLEDEGVASFTKSFDELIQRLTDKANVIRD